MEIMTKLLDVDCINKESFNIIVEYLENNEEMVKTYIKRFTKIELLNTIQFKVDDEFEFDMLQYMLNFDLEKLKKRMPSIKWNITMQ